MRVITTTSKEWIKLVATPSTPSCVNFKSREERASSSKKLNQRLLFTVLDRIGEGGGWLPATAWLHGSDCPCRCRLPHFLRLMLQCACAPEQQLPKKKNIGYIGLKRERRYGPSFYQTPAAHFEPRWHQLLGIGREGAGETEEREGAGGTEGRRRDEGGSGERESVTCVMEATLLLGSTIFKERSWNVCRHCQLSKCGAYIRSSMYYQSLQAYCSYYYILHSIDRGVVCTCSILAG